MRILAITDIHGRVECIDDLGPALASVDLVLLAGDLTRFGGHCTEAEEVVTPLRRHNANLLAIPGNCDDPGVDECLDRWGVALHRRLIIREGLGFVGVGGSLPCPGLTPQEYSEAELGGFLKETIDRTPAIRPRILVSHQPPFGSGADLASNGEHVGSREIRSFIEDYQPLICFTGHIHEGVGISDIGGTKVVNPGPLREGGYAYAEIDAGEIRTLEIRGRKA